MKTIDKPTYKCDYCKRIFQIKNAAEKHEIRCTKNPNNYRICHECNHLVLDKATIYYDTYVGEQSQEIKALYCNEFKHFVYPASVEHKKNYYEFGDVENKPMAGKTCGGYQ